MHSFFRRTNTALGGIQKFPDWLYVRDGLRRNLGTVLAYNRNNPTAVKSNHLLVTLLLAITTPKTQPIQRYHDNVDATALNLSMALKMTSPIYTGEAFKGIFYGRDTSEIIVAHSEPFDLNDALRHWQQLTPVKVLRHPRSDLGLNLLDGVDHGIEDGLAVITVNITMLAVQYRSFRIAQAAQSQGDTEKSVMQFIRMYVLPNMLSSHLDVALFNRFGNLVSGAPIGATVSKLPYYLNDYSKRTDKVYGDVEGLLKRHTYGFTGMLRSIPAAIGEDMDVVSRLPDIPMTRQVEWAMTVARLPQLCLLFEAAREGPGTRERSEVNKVIRDLTAYQSSNVFTTALNISDRMQVELELGRVVRASGRW